MIEQFITKTDSIKLSIFKELINHPGKSLNDLAETLSLSPNSAYRNLTSLITDIAKIDLPYKIEKKESHKYYLVGSEQNYLANYSKLSYYYGKESSMFNLCDLIMNSSPTMTQICHELFISPAHVYRIIKKLNRYLKEYNLSVEFNLDAKLELLGNEKNIRIFMFNYITHCIPVTVWNFKEFTKKELRVKISDCFDMDNIEVDVQHNLLVFWGIVFHRMYNKNFVDPVDKTFEEMFKFYSFLSENTIRQILPHRNNIKESILKSEIWNANFFLRVFLPEIIPDARNIDLGKKILHSPKPLVKFYVSLLDEWRSKYCIFLPEDRYYSFLNTAVLIFNLAIYIDLNILTIWSLEDLLISESDKINYRLFKDITNTIKDHVLNYPLELFDKNFFLEKQLLYLSCLMYIESQQNISPKIQFYISLTKDFRTKEFIKERIALIYNEDLIDFVPDQAQADIVIADQYSKLPYNGVCFVVSDFMGKAEWNSLLTKINDTFLSKLSER